VLIRLNQKQTKYVLDFLEKELDRYTSVPEGEVSLVECYLCGDERDVLAEPGNLFAIMPYVNPLDPSRGIILDEIRSVWACMECMKDRGL